MAMAVRSSAMAGHGERHGAGLERAREGRERERERVERAGELGSVISYTWGEVASEGSIEEPLVKRDAC